MNINRSLVKEEFNSYTAPYDLSDAKIRLKAEHTFRVAALCDRIAGSLLLGESDRDLAWLLGMLHDIGRFEQVRRYGTFSDASSVDHAVFGAELLFGQAAPAAADPPLIRRFAAEDEEDRLIEQAVRFHNVFALPEDLPDRIRMFAQILRDADKIDIMRANCEFALSDVYNLPEEEFEVSGISDAVLKDALSMRNVLKEHRRTAADYIVCMISLTFGLVYPESRRILREQGYIGQLMSFESRNPDTMAQLALIRAKVEEFLG